MRTHKQRKTMVQFVTIKSETTYQHMHLLLLQCPRPQIWFLQFRSRSSVNSSAGAKCSYVLVYICFEFFFHFIQRNATAIGDSNKCFCKLVSAAWSGFACFHLIRFLIHSPICFTDYCLQYNLFPLHPHTVHALHVHTWTNRERERKKISNSKNLQYSNVWKRNKKERRKRRRREHFMFISIQKNAPMIVWLCLIRLSLHILLLLPPILHISTWTQSSNAQLPARQTASYMQNWWLNEI